MRQRVIGDGRESLTVSELCLGTMNFGYRTDERTAFAILDRFRAAGGTFLDTANNYGQWHGDAGESERVLGRWMRSRGVTEQMVVATKVGARTLRPGDPSPEHWQGLSRADIRADVETSRRNLGQDRLGLYYAHIDDRNTPLQETVETMAELAESGVVGLLGCSNTALWRIERARSIARAAGRPAYSCIQQRHTYLLPLPGSRQSNLIGEEMLDYAESDGLTLLAYSPLLAGAYARGERPVGEYAHAANRRTPGRVGRGRRRAGRHRQPGGAGVAGQYAVDCPDPRGQFGRSARRDPGLAGAEAGWHDDEPAQRGRAGRLGGDEAQP